MATKRKNVVNEYTKDIPMSLDNHPFFGIVPDKEQKVLMDAVWKREKKVFLVDSIAGSGKTLISTALGVLMVKYGIYDKIVYITFPGIYEKTQGFLPGDLLTKSEPYFQPLYDALITIGELPDHVCNTSPTAVENGTAYIECAVSTYMRGINIDNAFVIIDEAENADLQTLTKVISRINDNSSVIIIGNMIQCDMYDKTKSGFSACIDYMTKEHFEIATQKVLMGNSITSIKEIQRINFLDIFEKINGVEEILKKDPANVYEKMDYKTKEYYRGKIKEISKKTKISEIYIARKMLELAQENLQETTKKTHIGYYLIDNGINKLYEKLEYTNKKEKTPQSKTKICSSTST